MVAVVLRGCFVTVLLGLALQSAAAQMPVEPPLPFTGIPKVPKTLPLLGHATMDGRVLAAATAGDADQIAWLIADGGDPDDADSEGRTALMHAAMANYGAVANALLVHNAQVDERDKLGDTALHWAAQTGSAAVLAVLLAAHADPNAADVHGVTPLMLAAGNNRPEAVRLLLQASADAHKTDFTGRDALSWGANYPRIVALLGTQAAAR